MKQPRDAQALHRAYLAETLAHLWPGTEITIGGRRGPRKSAAYLVLPHLRRPAAILPLSNWAALVRALLDRELPRSLNGPLVRHALTWAARLGLGRLLPDRVHVGPGDQESVQQYLQRILGDTVDISIRVGPNRANRKPVVQLMRTDGTTLAYAKLGVNPLTDRLVLHEAAALRRLATLPIEPVVVPRVIHQGSFQGHPIFVQTPLAPPSRGGGDDDALQKAMTRIADIDASPAVPLKSSAYWSALRQRVLDLPDHEATQPLRRLLRAAEQTHGTTPVPLGSWHGDFTPWNLSCRDATVSVWDWERFESGVPLGYDALHFAAQRHTTRDGWAPLAAARHLGAHAEELLDVFNLDAAQARATVTAYLLEIGTRYVEDDQLGAGGVLADLTSWLVPALEELVAPTTTPAPKPTPTPAAPGPALRGVGRGSVANLVGAAVAALGTFAVTLVVTHGMSADRAGVFFSATSMFLLVATLGTFGTDTSMVYFLARSRALNRSQLIPHYVRAGVGPVLVLSAVFGVAVLLFGALLASPLGTGDESIAASSLRVLALFLPLAAAETLLLAATRGLGTMKPGVVVDQLFRTPVQLLLVAVAIWASPSPWLICVAWAAPYLPAAVLAWWWWRKERLRTMGETIPRQHVAYAQRVRSEFWRYSAPRALASLGQMAIQRLDILLLAAISGSSAAAVYTAATRFLVVGQMGNLAVLAAVQPRLAASLSRHDLVTSRHLFRVTTAWIMLVTWPLFVTFLCLGSVVMGIFGSAYQTGGGVLAVLAISMLVALGSGIVDVVLLMSGRTSASLVNVVVALALNVGLDLWLIPRHGIAGAAIGWAVAIIAQKLLGLAQVARSMGLHPFGGEPVTAAFLCLGTYGGAELLARWLLGVTPAGLFVGVGLGTVVYAGLVWRLRAALHLQEFLALRRAQTAPAK